VAREQIDPVRFTFLAANIAAVFLFVACATNPQSRTKTSARRQSATAGCLDTLRAADSISMTIKMSVTPIDSATKMHSDFEVLFVEEFRASFKAPLHLSLSMVVGSPPCDSLGSRCVGGLLDVGAIAYATAHNDGKLSDIQVVDVALTPALADSMNAALKAMSTTESVPSTGDAESVPLVMELAPEAYPDTVPAERLVFRAKVPRYDLPFRYATMPAAGVDARFPFTARLAGVGDSVTIAFTVDSNGMIVPESLELVHATYRDFISSVLGALDKTRYHPAYLGDCPVATRMKQRFLFKVPD